MRTFAHRLFANGKEIRRHGGALTAYAFVDVHVEVVPHRTNLPTQFVRHHETGRLARMMWQAGLFRRPPLRATRRPIV